MSKNEFVAAAAKGIGELVSGAAKSAMESLVPVLKDTGKEVLKDTLKYGAQASIEAGVEHLSSNNNKFAQVAGQTLQAVGEKYLGKSHDSSLSENIGQARYRQLSENDQNITYLNNIENQIKNGATMKMR